MNSFIITRQTPKQYIKSTHPLAPSAREGERESSLCVREGEQESNPNAKEGEIWNIMNQKSPLSREMEFKLSPLPCGGDLGVGNRNKKQTQGKQMNRIQSLIQKYCPNGVEFKALGEVFHIKNGYTPSKAKKEFWENGTLPWFRMDDIRTNGRILNDSLQHITPQAVKSSGLFPANSLIIATTATIGEHALITVDSLANQQFTFLTKKVNCEHLLDMKFMFYYGFILGEWCKNNVNVSGFASVDMQKFKNFKIPIPPLEIQKEIVKILDSFTELEKELEARRKQYEYYREKLLSFESLVNRAGGGQFVKMMRLGEIGSFVRGNGLQKKDFVKSGVPCIHYGQIYTHYGTFAHETKSFVSEEVARKLKKANTGNLIIAGVSENKEDVCKAVVYLGNDEICISGDSFAFAHSQNPKFIGYFFQTDNFNKQKTKHITGTKVMRVHIDNLKTFQIPIPPLKVQNEVVEILDRFDALVNDITSGIPAEIATRKKQYEYYREQLLTFKEAQ